MKLLIESFLELDIVQIVTGSSSIYQQNLIIAAYANFFFSWSLLNILFLRYCNQLLFLSPHLSYRAEFSDLWHRAAGVRA
jgi:hypothetical protein